MAVVTSVATAAFAVVAGGAAAARVERSMAIGMNQWRVSKPLFTVGEEFGAYVPPGSVAGLAAYRKDEGTARVLATHELDNNQGYAYELSGHDEYGEPYVMQLTGARVSYFDVDMASREVVDSGLAYDTVYDANAVVATDLMFLPAPFSSLFGGASVQQQGFSRFGTPTLRGGNRGDDTDDMIFFVPEEDGVGFNSVGGAMWALDVEGNDLWQVPAMGRGGWAAMVEVASGSSDKVAFVLADGSVSFDVDRDGVLETAPLYLYVGMKDAPDFLGRNGLRNGQLYVLVAESNATRPSDVEWTDWSSRAIACSWVPIDNKPTIEEQMASEDGSTGFDMYGFPTQSTLWKRAAALGAFGFARAEDLAANPADPSEVALATTSVDSYAGGVEDWGNIRSIKINVAALTATVTNVCDGSSARLRSATSLEWASDGSLYVVQEYGQATDVTTDLSSSELEFPDDDEPSNATKTNASARILRVDSPITGEAATIARVDPTVVVDASLSIPTNAVDTAAGQAGAWKLSALADVASLFGKEHLLIMSVQALGISENNETLSSRIREDDLVQGGQILFLSRAQALKNTPMEEVMPDAFDITPDTAAATMTAGWFSLLRGPTFDLHADIVQDEKSAVRWFQGLAVKSVTTGKTIFNVTLPGEEAAPQFMRALLDGVELRPSAATRASKDHPLSVTTSDYHKSMVVETRDFSLAVNHDADDDWNSRVGFALVSVSDPGNLAGPLADVLWPETYYEPAYLVA